MFDKVQDVALLDSLDTTNLSLLERPELGVTFTKLHCWNLTKYTKCVFLDADTLVRFKLSRPPQTSRHTVYAKSDLLFYQVMRNCDELFDREELSAAPDVGWPDCFNSGVFVYRPSVNTFKVRARYLNI